MEWLGRFVVGPDVTLDGVFEISDGFEDAPAYFPAGDRGEEPLDRVEPRRRSGGEVECPSRMISDPGEDLGVFVDRVIVGDGMDDFPGRSSSFYSVQELNEILISMLFHPASYDDPMQDVKRGEQHSHAVVFVIVGLGSGFFRL